MAGGWSRDGAVQDQIDASVEDAIARARGKLARGESRKQCEDAMPPFRKPADQPFLACVCVLSASARRTPILPTAATTDAAARIASCVDRFRPLLELPCL